MMINLNTGEYERMTGYVQPLWLCLATLAGAGTGELNLEQQAQVTYLSGGHNAHPEHPSQSERSLLAQGHTILQNNTQGTVTGPPAQVTGRLGSGTAKAHKGVTPEPAQCSLDGHRGDEHSLSMFWESDSSDT